MKLQSITQINYDISAEQLEIGAERIVKEISEGVAPMVASWYILNESTNRYELDKNLVNEGITDIIKKGVGKINDAVTKGYSNLDAIKTKVVSGLKGKGDSNMLSKLGNLAKKNAKFVKPAVMIAVIGASLLGMDTASANEVLNQMDQLGGQEISDSMDQLQQSVPDISNADGGAGISPKLKSALENQVDGIFKIGDSQSETGLKTLNSKQAIYLAQEMTGQSSEQVIQKIMQNTNDSADIVRAFKDWVGTGVKKYATK